MFSATFVAALVVLATGLAHGKPVEIHEKEIVILDAGTDSNAGGGSEDVRSALRRVLNEAVNEFLQLPTSKPHDFDLGETRGMHGGVQLNAQITFQVDPETDKVDVKELAVTVTRKMEQWNRAVFRPKEAAGGKRIKRADGNPCGDEFSAVVKTVCKKEVVTVACKAFEEKTKGEVCFAAKVGCTAAILADGICDIVG